MRQLLLAKQNEWSTINIVSSTIWNPPSHENIEMNTHFKYLDSPKQN